MAFLDRERNLIVLRVVYDGPPEAGKTTSLRALAGSLGQPLYSPAEKEGRTLYFDWMDYTGGRFEGYQIRCQIVSLPGQPELAARRARLLTDADVIVVVADATRARLPETLRLLRELPPLLGDVAPPPVGLILQANKRDLPDAAPLAEIRASVRDAGLGVAVVESVASDGTGIRETFVFAVRLALDRVREQLRAGTLPVGRPEVDSGAALLDQLVASDQAALAAPALRQVLAENEVRLREDAPWHGPPPPPDGNGPRPPDPSAPSGAIWPPVEGRVILHEAAASRMTTHRLRNGSWAAGLGNGWRTYSAGDAEYTDAEVGREVLIRWARLHVACAPVLSSSRCIVLAATGTGSWRLWQIVRAERSLREQLEGLDRCGAEQAAARILEVAAHLAEMSGRLASAPCHLRCSLDTVARGERGPIYVGLMPMERASQPAPQSGEALGLELEAIFSSALAERRHAVMAALARVSREGPHAVGAGLVERLLGRGAGKMATG